MPVNLTAQDKENLVSILDKLIPANPVRSIPGAGEAGVADFVIAAMIEDSLVHDAIVMILKHVSVNPDEITVKSIEKIESNIPKEFNLLLTETYKGYYSRPELRAVVGVASHPVHPLGYRVESESENQLNQLTAPVRERGLCFRDTAASEDIG